MQDTKFYCVCVCACVYLWFCVYVFRQSNILDYYCFVFYYNESIFYLLHYRFSSNVICEISITSSSTYSLFRQDESDVAVCIVQSICRAVRANSILEFRNIFDFNSYSHRVKQFDLSNFGQKTGYLDECFHITGHSVQANAYKVSAVNHNIFKLSFRYVL